MGGEENVVTYELAVYECRSFDNGPNCFVAVFSPGSLPERVRPLSNYGIAMYYAATVEEAKSSAIEHLTESLLDGRPLKGEVRSSDCGSLDQKVNEFPVKINLEQRELVRTH